MGGGGELSSSSSTLPSLGSTFSLTCSTSQGLPNVLCKAHTHTHPWRRKVREGETKHMLHYREKKPRGWRGGGGQESPFTTLIKSSPFSRGEGGGRKRAKLLAFLAAAAFTISGPSDTDGPARATVGRSRIPEKCSINKHPCTMFGCQLINTPREGEKKQHILTFGFPAEEQQQQKKKL